jgi:hypothetical protein
MTDPSPSDQQFDITKLLGQEVSDESEASPEAIAQVLDDMQRKSEQTKSEEPEIPPGTEDNVFIVSNFTRFPNSDDPSDLINKMQHRIIELELACLHAKVGGGIDKCVSVLGSPYDLKPPHAE